MTDPVICLCESCATQGPLYLLRITSEMVAAVCVTCLRHPNVERITAAQAAERRMEQSEFRARRRRAESAA
jgi:hypothetical protein